VVPRKTSLTGHLLTEMIIKHMWMSSEWTDFRAFFNSTGSVYYMDCTTEMLTQYAWDQMYLTTQFGMENVPDVMWKSYWFIKEKWPNEDDQIVVITREEYDCIL
jgi:hypothetical protein